MRLRVRCTITWREDAHPGGSRRPRDFRPACRQVPGLEKRLRETVAAVTETVRRDAPVRKEVEAAHRTQMVREREIRERELELERSRRPSRFMGAEIDYGRQAACRPPAPVRDTRSWRVVERIAGVIKVEAPENRSSPTVSACPESSIALTGSGKSEGACSAAWRSCRTQSVGGCKPPEPRRDVQRF